MSNKFCDLGLERTASARMHAQPLLLGQSFRNSSSCAEIQIIGERSALHFIVTPPPLVITLCCPCCVTLQLFHQAHLPYLVCHGQY